MRRITAGRHTLIIPEKGSSCSLWESYYEELKQVTGKKNAKVLWLVTWKENGSSACLVKSGFVAWLNSHDLDVTNAATNAIADLSDIGDNLLGLGKGLTRLIRTGAPVALAIATVLMLFTAFRTAKSIDLTALATGKQLKRLGLNQ